MELDESKYVTLRTSIENLEQNAKTTISQFSEDYGGYLMILVNDIMYYFNNDGTLINSIDLSDSINSKYYTLIPYKVENGFLHYIISYPIDNFSFGFKYYKLNLNQSNFNIAMISKTIKPSIQTKIQYMDFSINYLSGGRCLFMPHPTLNREIFVCFYAICHPLEIQIRSFDPNNNFTELQDLFQYNVPLGLDNYDNPVFFDIVTDKQKKIVYILFGYQKAYRLTFDFIHNFKEVNLFTKHYITISYYQNKIYFFQQTNEYIFTSLTYLNCKIFMVRFDYNFNTKFEGELEPTNACYGTYTYSLIFSETNYSLLIDNSQYQKLMICKLNETKIIEYVDEPSTNYIENEKTEDIPNTIETIISNTIPTNTIPKIITTTFQEYDIVTNNVIILKTNKTKEEIITEENINEIFEDYEIGKICEIYGTDYNIKISPIGIHENLKNSTYIDFSSCENKLRAYYNITQDKILTIFQIEIYKNDIHSLVNQVEYAIFDEFNKMLDLSICLDEEIKIFYSISNSSMINTSYISYFKYMGVDIFNIHDNFFNDICYPYSESNSDLILKDRIQDIYQNYSLCDSNCEYENMDIINMKITCNCKVKTKIQTKIEATYNKIFTDIFKDSTFSVVKCFKLVFNLNKKNNIGFWLFLTLFIIQIPFIIDYIIYRDKPIKKYIEEQLIILSNFKINNPLKKHSEIKIANNNNAINFNNIKIKRRRKKKNSAIGLYSSSRRKLNDIYIQDLNNSFNKNEKDNIIQNMDILKLSRKKTDKIEKKKNKKTFNINYYINKYFILNYNNNIISHTLDNNRNNMNLEPLNISNNNNTISYLNMRFKNKIIKLNNLGCFSFLLKNKYNNKFTKNNLLHYNLYYNDNYKEATKYERRNFLKIFCIMLILKVKLINIFFYKSSIELKSIQICLFIFIYSCNFFLNTLFYSNDKISDKYHYNGNNLFIFTLFNNLSICLISTFLSMIIVSLLTFLTNSKKAIQNVFNEEKNIKLNNNRYKIYYYIKDKIIINKFTRILNRLKKKIIFFISIELILLLFFLYFITAFCEVYKNTQITWIMNCFTSFIISILSEILFAFVIATLYTFSLKKRIYFLFCIFILLL